MAIDLCRSKDAKHWLALSLQQLALAQQCVNPPDDAGIERHLKTALEFFDKAHKGGKVRTTFVVGSNGQAEKVSEK